MNRAALTRGLGFGGLIGSCMVRSVEIFHINVETQARLLLAPFFQARFVGGGRFFLQGSP